MTTNWRDEHTVKVGWVARPELGAIECDVVDVWRNRSGQYEGVKTVQFCKGKLQPVVWNHSQSRYVFSEAR